MPRRTITGLIVCLAAMTAAACGGGSSSPPTSPSPPPTVLPTAACSALGGTGIVNGTTCPSATSSVVLLNMRGQGIPVGACSGTIIAPRAILTAAHCLDEDVSTVQIWLGSGPQTVAASFTHFPNFRQNDPSSRDLGIVLMGEDLPRTPIPLITRDARVGETAVIAGWGQDQNTVPATHRAGTATISAVSSLFLETEFSPSASSICSGDSGGPILLSEGGVWSIAGVTSAASTAGCTTGTNFFVNLRNPVASAFILGLVPDAARR